MEERNRYLLEVFILFIFVSSLFFACKTDRSLTSALIEQTTNNKCTYTYPKYDEDNKTILRYCFTECNKCPTADDISSFNYSKEGKEKLSNELCPLNEKNQEKTSYIDANEITSNIIKNYIGDYTLQLKNLKGRELTVYEEIKNHKINVDPNNIKNNEILKNCSRDFLFDKYNNSASLSIGTVIKTSEENNSYDESFLEEYGIGSITFVNDYEKHDVIVHIVDNEVKEVWKLFGIATTFDSTRVLPKKWHLPSGWKCSDIAKSFRFYLQFVNTTSIPSNSRFWLEDQASYNTHYTCRIDTGTYSTSQDSYVSLPVIVEPWLVKYELKSFTPFKNFFKK